MPNNFTAIFLKSGKWYTGFAKEIPGINTQGKSLPAVRKNLREAAALFNISHDLDYLLPPQ